MLRRTWQRYRWWWLLIAAAAVSAIAGLIAQSLPVLAGVLVVGVIGGLTALIPELPGLPSDAGSMRCLAIERLTEIVLL
jgi:hypothetical protein